MDASPNARAVAARIVTAWRETGDFPDRMVDHVRADHAMVMDLSLGVVRWVRLLEYVCGTLAKRKPRPEVESFLLVGAYQLLVMQGMADHAAVNETVEAAKQELGRNTADFINAILRRIIREREDLRAAIDRQPDGIRFSHPDALLERWFDHFGEEPSRKLCEWNNRPPETILRLNAASVSAESFRERLRVDNIQVTPHPFRPGECFVLQRGVRVPDVPGFREGWFAVQDPSTLIAPELLGAKPGETVLDACAAPGGKTMILAEEMVDAVRWSPWTSTKTGSEPCATTWRGWATAGSRSCARTRRGRRGRSTRSCSMFRAATPAYCAAARTRGGGLRRIALPRSLQRSAASSITPPPC